MSSNEVDMNISGVSKKQSDMSMINASTERKVETTNSKQNLPNLLKSGSK